MTQIIVLFAFVLLWAPTLWHSSPASASDFVRTTGGGGGSFNRFPSREPEEAEPEDAATPEAEAAVAAGLPEAPPAVGAPETAQEDEPEASGDDEEDDPVPERTHGKACIYGPRGQVLYQPEGKGCGERDAVPASAADDPSLAPRQGHCMYSDDGRVLYKPPGAVCGPRRRQLAPAAQ